MRRVRTIKFNTSYSADIRAAMYSAVAPFGSLSPAIADLALAYVGADIYAQSTCTIEAATALITATRAEVTDDHWSEVLCGESRMQLITPTSRTVIELRRYAGGWDLIVDFGDRGSDARADQILECPDGSDLSWTVTPVSTPPQGSDAAREAAS